MKKPTSTTSASESKSTETSTVFAAQGGKVLLSSIAENKDMLHDLLGVSPIKFRPAIPNLIYQYNLFANYTPVRLNVLNPEIEDE